ncbi:MAG: MxaK protein [Rubrivivax sp.]
MGLTRPMGRHPTRNALLLLAVLALLAAHDGWRLVQVRALNARIAAGTVPEAEAPGAPREARFAAAWAQAASGAADAALARYGTLHGDDALGRAARFNSANLLLRQAARLRESSQPGQALALVELAKEQYREILRTDPADWPARYNLERAQRLVPDPEEEEEAPADVKRNAERAATTMRGFSPGLP